MFLVTILFFPEKEIKVFGLWQSMWIVSTDIKAPKSTS